MIPLPQTCEGCPLYEPAKGFSRLEGDGSSGLMVIAESLGYHEERAALPLRPNAPSGGIFQKALKVYNLQRDTMTLTNTLRCKCEAPYPPEAIAHCSQYLDQAIEERQPKFLLCLGDVPLQALTTIAGSQADLRGFILPSKYGIPMLATFHPSRVARGEWSIFNVMMWDIRQAMKFAAEGVPEKLPTRYILRPTIDDVEAYLDRVLADPSLPISYDIETLGILGHTESESLADKHIIQIQFSSAVGEAIVLPFEQPFIDLAKRIMATPNPKWDYWGRNFDRRVLRAQGFTINGETHDLFDAAGHLQPNWLSSKDDLQGDKGVPSKLMGLQSWVSLYHPEVGSWKGMVRKALPALRAGWGMFHVMDTLRLYGAYDCDYSFRLGQHVFAALRKNDLYDGYYTLKFRFSEVLDDLTDRGLPIDREAQADLRAYIRTEDARLDTQLQQMIASELLSRKAYKGLPKDFRTALKVQGCKPPKNAAQGGFCDRAQELAASMQFEFIDGWLNRVSPFNPNSPQQLIRYIVYKNYDIPLDIDTGKFTTGKEGIDQLIRSTGDEVLTVVRQMRQLTKISGTYAGKEIRDDEGNLLRVEGDWVPAADGRVHPQWGFLVSGQKAARKPNSGQYPQHGKLAKLAKACIKAEAGHTFVSRDYRAFHAKSLAWISGDERYWKLATYDVHSYVSAYFLKLPIAPRLLDLPESELRTELAKIKDEHADVRNLKAKRAILGLGFHMGVDKLWRMNPEAFESPQDAQQLIKLIQSLFPQAFVEFPKRIEKQIRQSPCLRSPMGSQRWVWSQDLEEAVSYLPASIAHGHIDESLLIMHDRGLLDRWQFVNFIHDSVLFHVPNSLIDECLEGSREVMERESEVLIDSPLGIPFQCATDAKIGTDLANMTEIHDTP